MHSSGLKSALALVFVLAVVLAAFPSGAIGATSSGAIQQSQPGLKLYKSNSSPDRYSGDRAWSTSLRMKPPKGEFQPVSPQQTVAKKLFTRNLNTTPLGLKSDRFNADEASTGPSFGGLVVYGLGFCAIILIILVLAGTIDVSA